MAQSRSQKFVFVAISAAMLAACASEAPADDEGETAAASDAPPVIEERQANFEGIGDAFKAIRGQLEGGSPDLAIIGASASDINERAQAITGHFPEGTSVDDGFDTEALATIWEKPAEFETAAQNLVEASATLATIAESGDAAAVMEQVKEMGGTCKACHDNFRVDDD